MFASNVSSQRLKSFIRIHSLVYLLMPVGALCAQAPETAVFHAAAQAALGGTVAGIELRGSGWDACLGQAWSVAEGWARWELTDYRRVIDYDDAMSSHNTQRRAGMDADRIGGCGAQPAANPAPQQGFIDANSPWADQLLIWLTPHGFLQLLEAGAPVIAPAGTGWQVTLPHTREGITYTFVGNFNASHELQDLTHG